MTNQQQHLSARADVAPASESDLRECASEPLLLPDGAGALPASMDGPEVESLIRTVRTLVAKGDKAAAKSEQFYVAAGQHLWPLKNQHRGSWAEWEDLLKERCGLGKSRASELMRIANGTTTVEQIRSEKAESVRKVRAVSPLRSGESREVAVVERDEPDTRPHPVDDVEESAARRKAEAAEANLRDIALLFRSGPARCL
jgi:hypothetical protein